MNRKLLKSLASLFVMGGLVYQTTAIDMENVYINGFFS
jgi:hypothetical protein